MALSIKQKLGKTVMGGEIISRILQAEGVTKAFGIADGTYWGTFGTLRDYGIDIIGPRHEACAVHAAGAYSAMSGGLGVCLASNGPGVANAISGVAVENAEGHRVLLITSCRREAIVYPDRGGTYQCFPHTEVTRAMSKWSCTVRSVERVAELTRKAMRMAYTGRPGVVHLDVPEDIMNCEVPVDPSWFGEPAEYRSTTPMDPPSGTVAEAAAMIRAAKRPLIHVGCGVLHGDATAPLKAVAEAACLPITTSWGARAVIDERSDYILPMIYMNSLRKARCEADLVLVVGSRLGETDWWGKAPYWGKPDAQKLIWVDIDPEVIGATRRADLAIQADAKRFLGALATELGRGPTPSLSARRKHLEGLRKSCNAERRKLDKQLSNQGVPMVSAHAGAVCREVFDDDAICVLDGGNTAVWGHMFYEVRGINSLLQTAKMGMLGAGIPQAIGAQIAHPERQVFCIIGDGAMGFNLQEVETAVRNGLPVIFIVLCDKQWGMVKVNQCFTLRPVKTLIKKTLDAGETINTDLNEIEFDVVARGMGAYGERVSDPQGLAGALRRAQASGRCAVIHVDVDPVKHMWAPGLRAFKDMHQEPAG